MDFEFEDLFDRGVTDSTVNTANTVEEDSLTSSSEDEEEEVQVQKKNCGRW